MTEKQTILRAIDVSTGSTLILQFALIITEGDAVLGSRSHVLSMEPGTDVAAAITNLNDNLARLTVPFPSMLAGLGLSEQEQVVSYPPVRASDVKLIEAKADDLWTEDVLAEARKQRDVIDSVGALQGAEAAADAAVVLPKWKFWAQLDLEGGVRQFREAIAAMTDTKQRAIINAQLDHESELRRDNTILRGLLVVAGFDDIDAFWSAAQELQAT